MARSKKIKHRSIVWLVLALAGTGVAWQVVQATKLQVVALPPSEPPASTIVKFDVPAAKQLFLNQNHLKATDLKPIPKLNAYVAPIKPSEIAAANNSSTHPNLPYHVLLAPNDPFYVDQWWLRNISAPSGWDLTTGSSNITVAVIDTGFALNHEDLNSQWAENGGENGLTRLGDRCWTGIAQDKKTNNCDDDNNGFVDDWRGWDFSHSDNDPNAGTTNPASQYVSHGTMTAGLAGATSNNNKGVASVSWGTRILPLQAMDDNGAGYTDAIAAAIHYAVDRGAKVISLSLGSSAPDDFMRTEIDAAIAKGVTVIAAAGNSDCACMVYPANYPEVIAVGATDQNDNRASFSSYGPNLDIMAPGSGSIKTTLWTSANQTSAYTSSAYGTSIATPIVSGVAALLLSRQPDATPDDIMRFLARGADRTAGMGGLGRSDLYGYGRINSYQSLLAGSLATPRGQLLNKHSASLSSLNTMTDPNLNATCQTTINATCDIRLTGPNGEVKLLGMRASDQWGGVNFYWNANSIGMTAGRWKVEAISYRDNQTTILSADYLEVSQ